MVSSPAARPFVGSDRRGIRDVERSQGGGGRNSHQPVALFRRKPAQAFALGAQYDGDAALQVEAAELRVAALIEPVEPEASILELFQRAREVHRTDQRHQ